MYKVCEFSVGNKTSFLAYNINDNKAVLKIQTAWRNYLSRVYEEPIIKITRQLEKRIIVSGSIHNPDTRPLIHPDRLDTYLQTDKNEVERLFKKVDDESGLLVKDQVRVIGKWRTGNCHKQALCATYKLKRLGFNAKVGLSKNKEYDHVVCLIYGKGRNSTYPLYISDPWAGHVTRYTDRFWLYGNNF